MLRKKLSPPNKLNSSSPVENGTLPQPEAVDIDIYKEFNRVEETVLESQRIPFTRLSIIDEDKLLNHLDFIRINLPDAFERAQEVLRRKQEILIEAENYAQDIVKAAQTRAAQILDESELVRRAEIEANQIRQRVHQDCSAFQQQTRTEIEQMRLSMQQEIEQYRQATLAECRKIERGADEYADAVLGRIEQQLDEMLKVVNNGRQQLRANLASRASTTKPPTMTKPAKPRQGKKGAEE